MNGYMMFFRPGDTWRLGTEDLRAQLEAMKAWDRLQAHYGLA